MVTVSDIFADSFINWYYTKEVPDEDTICGLIYAIHQCPEEFNLTVDDVCNEYVKRTGIDNELLCCMYTGWVLGQV